MAVFFVPTNLAIHGITPRGITVHERKLINLSIELPEPNSFALWSPEAYYDPMLDLGIVKANRLMRLFPKLPFVSRLLRHSNSDKYSIYSYKDYDEL